ncbi:MAG TPA: flagellar hook protein FlgE [Bacteroidota bacterium]|nr:flagellar hook protein FlgE [Bacteroidota bacterium]
MGFLRALSSGVSGLRGHQTMMDVIGNNISNINTIGFKSGRVTFSEAFAQTLRNANLPQAQLGGTNPQQVGLGIQVTTIDTQFSQGNMENTSNVTDLALQGNGFFIVKQNGKQLYTRSGAFSLDADGRLVNAGSGAVVQGKIADANGVLPSGNNLADIVIPTDIKSPAQATTEIKWKGNLNASAPLNTDLATNTPEGSTTTGSAIVYDSLGNKYTVTLKFAKTADVPQTWAWTATRPDPASTTSAPLPGIEVGTGAVTFNTDGSLASPDPATPPQLTFDPANGANPVTVNVTFGEIGKFSGLTASQGLSTISTKATNGYGLGSLNNISVETDGTIRGIFSNGTLQTLGQVMIADFNNPGGLQRVTGSMYDFSGNSGVAQIGAAGSVNSSQVLSNSLEQSNVDLAEEFTKMIIAQRGFQANAKVITSSDEFMQEIVNIKR